MNSRFLAHRPTQSWWVTPSYSSFDDEGLSKSRLRRASHCGCLLSLAMAIIFSGNSWSWAGTWDGSAPNNNWNTSANWNTLPGVNQDANFRTADTQASGVTNVVNINGFDLRNLDYRYNSANRHHTEIGAGVTLHVRNELRSGIQTSVTGGNQTLAIISGNNLTIGSVASPGNIIVGRRDGGGNGLVKATLDMSGLSTLTGTLVAIDVGRKTGGNNSGTEQAQGTLLMPDSVTLDLNRVFVSDSPHSGLGSLQSRITFGDNTTLSERTGTNGEIRIGGRKGNGRVDIVAGGSLKIEGQTATNHWNNLRIGYNAVNSGSDVIGLVDLSGGDYFEASVGTLLMGRKSGGGNGTARGRLILAKDNLINADTITMGESDNGGQTAANLQQRILLGETNEINVNTWNVSKEKSNALVEFQNAGGELNLSGNSNARANLYVGRNIGNTGSNGIGMFDMSGGTINALINNLRLGDTDSNGTSGSGTGTFIMDAGTVDVNTVLFGRYVDGNESNGILTQNGGTLVVNTEIHGGTNSRSNGTYNLNDGALVGGGILDLQGTDAVDNFNWNGGVVGISQIQGTLDQNDPDTKLAAGNSGNIDTMTISETYNLLMGMLEVEIAGTGGVAGTDFDFYDVGDDANLNSIVSIEGLGGFVPEYGDSFDVLEADSILLGPNFGVDAVMFDDSFLSFEASLVDLGGGRSALRLTVVPEPTSIAIWTLLGLCLAAYGCRRMSPRSAG